MYGAHGILMRMYDKHISQVVALLGCSKPHVLDIFKNTPTLRLHLVLFPVEKLRQAVETAKEISPRRKLRDSW